MLVDSYQRYYSYYDSNRRRRADQRRIFFFIASPTNLLFSFNINYGCCAFRANCSFNRAAFSACQQPSHPTCDIKTFEQQTEHLWKAKKSRFHKFSSTKPTIMSLSASRIVVGRAMTRRAPVQQQKRKIVDYLTNYPDKVRPEPSDSSVVCYCLR